MELFFSEILQLWKDTILLYRNPENGVVTLQTWQRSTSRVSRCSLCCATNGRGV